MTWRTITRSPRSELVYHSRFAHAVNVVRFQSSSPKSLNQSLAVGVEMRRRDLVVGVAATLFAVPSRAFSQQTPKLPHIGVLVAASPPHPFVDAFQRGLRTFGYSEGRNISTQFLYTDGRGERAAE